MMTTKQNEYRLEAPSKSDLLKATGIALFVALLLIFTVVLPAEYGFDPLKTGAALKLTGISQTPEVKRGAAPTPAPGKTGVYRSEPGIYKVESEDFTLSPGDGMEMKYHMQKGAEMVYSWKANGKLAYEF